MLVVVNTRLLIPGKLDGIGRFTFETLKRITVNHPDSHFVFLFDREIAEEFVFAANITPVKLFPPARRVLLFKLWFNWSVAGVLRDLKPDLFLSPDGFLPLRTATKCLPVMHDLNFEHYPEDLPSGYSRYYRKYFPLFAKKAARICTVSEFSKNDIAEKYGITKEKIDVVYNGASEGFRPLPTEEIEQVRKKYANGQPYFLYIGALHPRKNLARLIRAYGLFRKKNSSATKLIIAGGNYWMNEELNAAVKSIDAKSDVIFTGRLEENELYRLSAGALALTYVPYFEGFGIPIVEAMACNVPVLTSNITSMPEVGGDAVLYADPFSEESIAGALAALDQDLSLRQLLIAKGIVRREIFSWDKTADRLWLSMEKSVQTDC
ncbi:MAG TPA: glycosyltransferase family 1 protein [Bacteroidia bacterium]|nr:glycosyltransferase family 1 protein [Bacteroidia bacterium]